MPQISIVIVTWNSQEVLPGCVSSLFKYVAADQFELILVDNASREADYLEAYRSLQNVKILKNHENLGFSKAVNLGAIKAVGEFLLVLNPDIIFQSNPFPRLLQELKKDPEIGVIGPLLYGLDGCPQIENFYPTLPSISQFILLRSALMHLPFAIPLAMRFFHAQIGPRGVFYVEQIPGAFLLFRRSLFGSRPVLNEAYFIWMEDVDFCFEIRRMGKKSAVVADEKVTHIGGTSFQMQSVPWKRLMFTQSYLTYLSLHFPTFRYSVHIIVMALNALLILTMYPFSHYQKGPSAVISRMGLEAKVFWMILKSGAIGLIKKMSKQ